MKNLTLPRIFVSPLCASGRKRTRPDKQLSLQNAEADILNPNVSCTAVAAITFSAFLPLSLNHSCLQMNDNS